MTEGKEVRQAFDGPTVEHDELIDFITARSAEEHARGSDASESAAKVKEFVEETGLNSQALSWIKTIHKKLPKKDGQAKAMDIIRSLKKMLPMIENHVGGQGTVEMDLDGDGGTASEAADLDQDQTDFDAAADEALGNDTVTPIDFSKTAAE